MSFVVPWMLIIGDFNKFQLGNLFISWHSIPVSIELLLSKMLLDAVKTELIGANVCFWDEAEDKGDG